jgi:hypothetical protein
LDDLLTKIMKQTDEFRAIYNKGPDDISMNGETYQELKKELRADDPSRTDYRINQTYGMNVSTIMGIKIYINENVPAGQMFFRSGGGVKAVVMKAVVITNIGKPSKPSKLSRFTKKRMIRIE